MKKTNSPSLLTLHKSTPVVWCLCWIWTLWTVIWDKNRSCLHYTSRPTHLSLEGDDLFGVPSRIALNSMYCGLWSTVQLALAAWKFCRGNVPEFAVGMSVKLFVSLGGKIKKSVESEVACRNVKQDSYFLPSIFFYKSNHLFHFYIIYSVNLFSLFNYISIYLSISIFKSNIFL